jgi:archaellum component FlaC
MSESSRVQKMLIEQNAEIDRLKNHIKKLEVANLKCSLIKLDDEMRIEKLETVMQKIDDRLSSLDAIKEASIRDLIDCAFQIHYIVIDALNGDLKDD